jgi:glycosyltransferase involved in cell wall biosynthesis
MKLRIGYLLGSNSKGGLEMNQVRNALWMHQRGHSVFLLCIKGSPAETMANDLGVPVVNIAKHRKYYDFKQGKALAKILLEQQISRLIVRATQDMSVAVIAKRAMKGKLHLSYFMEMQLGVKKTNFLHTFRFRHFDLWSCPLNWLEHQVHTMTKFPKDRTVVIPSGMDLSLFADLPTKTEARRILDLPQDMKIFGLIGRFDVQKGQLLLLNALLECRRKDFGVLFLGEPTHNEADDYYAEMQELIRSEGLEDRVFIRPFRKDIGTFYKAVDWFVMASKAETFGMVTIEAMACGTPTLGSNAGGTPELLKFGELGVLFETLNAKDLALKIEEIMEGKHEIGAEILKQEARRFDHVKVCGEVERVLVIGD